MQFRLDPRNFLNFIKNNINNTKDEVFIRRMISAIYFSLYNFWSEKEYKNGKRGKGPLQDSFSHRSFIQDMLNKGLDIPMYVIYRARVAVDHYTLNPTYVKLMDRPWSNKTENVFIDFDLLSKVLDASEIILENI